MRYFLYITDPNTNTKGLDMSYEIFRNAVISLFDGCDELRPETRADAINRARKKAGCSKKQAEEWAKGLNKTTTRSAFWKKR